MFKKLLVLIGLAIVPSMLKAEGDAGIRVLSSAGGRFVFGQTSLVRVDQFMLDTQTGRLWQYSINSNNQGYLTEVKYTRKFIDENNQVWKHEISASPLIDVGMIDLIPQPKEEEVPLKK